MNERYYSLEVYYLGFFVNLRALNSDLNFYFIFAKVWVFFLSQALPVKTLTVTFRSITLMTVSE